MLLSYCSFEGDFNPTLVTVKRGVNQRAGLINKPGFCLISGSHYHCDLSQDETSWEERR